MTLRQILATIALLLTATLAGAQDDPQYRWEIGAGVDMVSYEGDFNGNITKNMKPGGSLLLRRVFNPFMGLRLNAMYGKLKGSSTDVKTYYPDFQETPYEFDNTLIDVSMTYEYNFWPYGTGRDYREAKRITPFFFGGFGVTYVKYGTDVNGKSNAFTANVPIGLGIKYKIGERVNLGLEWAIHFSLSDELDGVKDPYHVESSGAFKNTDCYSAFQLSLTYSFGPKCQTCNKDF